MKSLTIHTLVVAVALALGTPSLAATGELSSQPVSPAQKDTTSATAATSAGPLYALNRLDTQALATQEMTDQELKAVEGGWGVNIIGAVYTYSYYSCDAACESATVAISTMFKNY